MGTVYMIRNKINGKAYIGKTLNKAAKRWSEHLNDYKKDRCKNRPLYRAMLKYGVDSFELIELEKCNADVINEREQYYIAKFNTYGSQGYNATKGGDGKKYLPFTDEDVIKAYMINESMAATAKQFGCDSSYVADILVRNDIKIKNPNLRVSCIVYRDVQTKTETRFNTYDEAYNYFTGLGYIKCTKQSFMGAIATSIRKTVASAKYNTYLGGTWVVKH